mgnify:CR=1 FL=1
MELVEKQAFSHVGLEHFQQRVGADFVVAPYFISHDEPFGFIAGIDFPLRWINFLLRSVLVEASVLF